MAPLLEIKNLKKWFRSGQDTVHAVNGISLDIEPGEVVALVGESGCGKSTTARCVLKLTDPTEGQIIFNGTDISQMPEKKFRAYRRQIQMVFQDPTMSLNPLFTVRRTLAEPLKLQGLAKGPELEKRIIEILEKVQLGAQHLDRYPRQLSGGQRQRVGIARALITQPELVVLDEPTSALDMSVKLSVVNLLRKLQKDLNATYLLITHDMNTVKHLCSRVMVMYLGRIVEAGPVSEVFSNPQHPYTRALLSAIPVADPDAKKERMRLEGDTPSPVSLPKGCSLVDRCPLAEPRCAEKYPETRTLPGGHDVACHLVEETESVKMLEVK
ncbi:ABC transporter ATP-binding protein [Alkalihalobacterium alkalinitrilicum]|uniref:ABC transporter ATP-binding protein n=1 Tax=Alkalihalobacterium alkalinitrilicum TaxID=427920 RepID=UPI001EE427EB|nr:ABC transporter ATP-binding protein [Alkalihalobacterium alkalinitrilicum]